jgi:hypothetical protein
MISLSGSGTFVSTPHYSLHYWLSLSPPFNEHVSSITCISYGNPLNLKEREREEKVGGVAIDTTFNGRGGHKFRFAATKVPRQCPLVLLVKVGLVKLRRLEVKKGRIRSGARREAEQGLMRSCAILNFDISLGRAAFDEIWTLIWGATLGRNFDVNIGRAA